MRQGGVQGWCGDTVSERRGGGFEYGVVGA